MKSINFIDIAKYVNSKALAYNIGIPVSVALITWVLCTISNPYGSVINWDKYDNV